jgi:hypothetical protein
MGRKFLAGFVQIDFLPPKGEGASARAEGNDFPAQNR